MTTEKILHDLNEVFIEVFRDESISLTEQTTASDITAWDSLTHIDLIVCAEEKFDIRIPTLKAAQLKNVGELVSLIKANLDEK